MSGAQDHEAAPAKGAAYIRDRLEPTDGARRAGRSRHPAARHRSGTMPSPSMSHTQATFDQASPHGFLRRMSS